MRARSLVYRLAMGALCAAAASGAEPAAAAGATLALATSVTTGIGPTNVTLTATVSGATLTGSIVFKDGLSTVGTAVINKSKAALTTPLGVGIHRFVAVHSSAGSEIDSPEVDVVIDNALACK